MKMHLTEAALLKFRPRSARDEIFDTNIRGFGVRVTRTSKTFFYIRRIHGQKIRFDLGRFLPKEEIAKATVHVRSADARFVCLAEARKRAQEILIAIESGLDPREEINTRKQAAADMAEKTFAYAGQRFIAEYAEGKKRPLSKRTIKGYRWALQGALTANWALRPITAITDHDVIRLIDKLETDKHFASARLLRAYLSKFFNWCIGKRLIRESPTRGIALASDPLDFKRDRHLCVTELRAVLRAADGLVRRKTGRNGKEIVTGETQRALVQMLTITGQRRGETSLMKWSDLSIESEKPLWKIPAENTKNGQAHEVPLSPYAVEILLGLPKLGEYVFTTDGKTPISGFSKIKATLDTAITVAGLRLVPWRLHDLRRSVSTGLGELGFPPHVIEMVMNHISGAKAGVSGLYNRSRYDSDCRRALAAWAQTVASEDQLKNVVQLHANHPNDPSSDSATRPDEVSSHA